MRPGRTLLPAALLLVLGGTLVPSVVRHASAPPFEPSVPLRRRPQVEFEGLRLLRSAGDGTVEVRAAHAAPGHRRLGEFALGPSTFLSLHEVEVHYRAPDGSGWTGHAAEAELEDAALTLTQEVTLAPAGGGRPRACRRVRIAFGSGAVEIDG